MLSRDVNTTFTKVGEFFNYFLDKDSSEIIEFVDRNNIVQLYEGETIKNIPNGIGKLYSISRETEYKIRLDYYGEFINNYPRGEGVYFYYNGEDKMTPTECYKGDVLGLPHGIGLVYLYNTKFNNWMKIFEGNFKYGEKESSGREYYTNTDQTKFIGNYYNGLKNGFGVEFDLNGEIIYEGTYAGDERHGLGICYSGPLEIRSQWQYGRISKELSSFLNHFLKTNLKNRDKHLKNIDIFEHNFRGSKVIMNSGCNLFLIEDFLRNNSFNLN